MAGEMVWSTNSGYLTNDQLSRMLRVTAQPIMRFRSFVRVKEAFGKHKGQTVNFTKVSNVGTYGGTLVETNTMHETEQTLTQGSVTVAEYGNSIPFTFKLEALSEFDIRDIVETGLANDMAKVMEGLIERQFNGCALRAVGTATNSTVITTNGTATIVNTSVLNEHHIRKMALELKKRNVPGFSSAGGDYAMICSHEAIESLQGAMTTINQYTETGFSRIVSGEQGRIHGVRIIEDGFATRFTYNASARTATAKSWSQGLSLDAYMFGSPTVTEAVAVPEEIRVKIPTDYGRSQGIAWYFIGNWQLIYGTSEAADCRIIKWDSAS